MQNTTTPPTDSGPGSGAATHRNEHHLAGDPADLPDARGQLAHAIEITGTVVAAVRPDRLTRPTPCSGYDVRQLTEHVLYALDQLAAAGRRPLAAAAEPFRLAVAPEAYAATYAALAEEVSGAWAPDERLGEVVELEWATMPGAAVVAAYVAELIVHGADLAKAIDATPVWDEPAVELALATMQFALGPEARGPERPFGAEVAAPAGASTLDRLLAFTGRQP